MLKLFPISAGLVLHVWYLGICRPHSGLQKTFMWTDIGLDGLQSLVVFIVILYFYFSIPSLVSWSEKDSGSLLRLIPPSIRGMGYKSLRSNRFNLFCTAQMHEVRFFSTSTRLVQLILLWLVRRPFIKAFLQFQLAKNANFRCCSVWSRVGMQCSWCQIDTISWHAYS